MPVNSPGGLVLPRDTPSAFSPFSKVVSGLYLLDKDYAGTSLPLIIHTITLRLDIDGCLPQNMLSLTIDKKRGKPVHILACKLRSQKSTITFKFLKSWGGALPFGKTYKVSVELLSPWSDTPSVVLTCSAAKNNTRVFCHFTRVSESFRKIYLEYDRVEGVQSVVSMPQTAALHEAAPASLPANRLSVAEVFRRAGIGLVLSGDHSAIPLTAAGGDHAWNRRELHDAMQSYWSHYSTLPQWSMWVLFANLYAESGAVAGMMFDTNKKSQRRGLALFNHSMMFDAPPGEPAKGDWQKRMRFFTLCHEMGHLFNLAHSWEKSQGRAWMHLKDTPDALSFMNNPHVFDGGYDTFFKNFLFQFDNGELQFLRHAPDDFVKMGYSAWFENHALLLSGGEKRPFLTFELRTGRVRSNYTFMEPVVIEAKIKNVADSALEIDITDVMLAEKCCLYITCSRWKRAKKIDPYSYCEYGNVHTTLAPKKSLFGSLFISAGASGWAIDLPGRYTVQGYIYINGTPVVSNKLTITVEKPLSRSLEAIAADYFDEEVGRVLAFDGSSVLSRANDILHRCVEPDIPSTVAHHARIALALPLTAGAKRVHFGGISKGSPVKTRVLTAAANHEFAGKQLGQLFKEGKYSATEVAAALGNIDFKKYADMYTCWLEKQGNINAAFTTQQQLHSVLKERGVDNNDILGKVVKRMEQLKSSKIKC